MTISCVDLNRPELCQIPTADWTTLTDNQLAIAYASTAIGNLYHFVHDWFTAIKNGTGQAAISDVLSYQITDPFRSDINGTTMNSTALLASLMTTYGTNSSIVQSFIGVVSKAIDVGTVIDFSRMDRRDFQNTLCQALGEALNATLSDWNTPYFEDLSKNGALLGDRLEYPLRLKQSLDHISSPDPLKTTLLSSLSSSNNNNNNSSSSSSSSSSITRALLSADVTQTEQFFIHECNADSPGGLASQLSTLLTAFHENLYHVMKEASKGPRSQLGFRQIFKTQKWIPIRRLYEHMFHGVGTRGNPAASQAIADNRPVFICLQPYNPATRGAYAVCNAEPRLRAFQQPGAPYAIGLCPSFWALPAAPVRAFCPHAGEVSEEYTGNALQLNQQSIIIHQLVRIYLGADVLDPERFTLSEVLELSADEAYRNPSTWSYWFSSVIGCTPQSWDGL